MPMRNIDTDIGNKRYFSNPDASINSGHYKDALTFAERISRELGVTLLTAVLILSGCRGEQPKYENNLSGVPVGLVEGDRQFINSQYFAEIINQQGLDGLDCLDPANEGACIDAPNTGDTVE